MDDIDSGPIKFSPNVLATGLVGLVFMIALSEGALSKDKLIWARVRSSDNSNVLAIIQAPIDKTWQDVANTDQNGEKNSCLTVLREGDFGPNR